MMKDHQTEEEWFAKLDAEAGYPENQYAGICKQCGHRIKPGKGWVMFHDDQIVMWHKTPQQCGSLWEEGWGKIVELVVLIGAAGVLLVTCQ